MKSIFKLSFLFFSIICCSTKSLAQNWYEMMSDEPINIEAIKKNAEKHFDTIGRGNHTGYKQYRRWLNDAILNMDKNGIPYSHNHDTKELEKFRTNTINKQQNRTNTSNKQQNLIALNFDADNSWTPMGPTFAKGNSDAKNLGKIPVMAIEPIDQKLLFVGAHGGGLWRSTDAGESWIPLADNFDNMYIIAIGIDPFNTKHIIYMNDNSEIFESLDQGDTWNLILNLNRNLTNYIKAIKFHPTIQDVYFVTGRVLIKTTDGGKNFKTVLEEDNQNILFKPGDPTTMYSVGDDFWKSTDTGETWTQTTNGISVSEKMKMTVTPTDPNVVYLIQKQDFGFGRIYKSTDSGDSFEIMSDINDGAPNYLGVQGARCMTIMCSTSDPDKLHMGGLRNFRSDDGGATLYEVPNSQNSSGPAYFHADVLTMNNVNGTLYVSSDGGIYRSTDDGENYTALAGNGLMVTQFYRIGSSAPYPGTGENLDPDIVIGGAQDNGTKISKGINHEWENWLGSDGMECFVDYTNDDILYGSKQHGVLARTDDAGKTFKILYTPESGEGAWTTPFEMDPVTPTTIYSGYTELYMSTNSGEDWETMTSGQTEGSDINQIAIAPSDNNYMYFSQSDRLWVSTNAQSPNRTWREISDIENIDGWINYITIDPNNPLHALIAKTGSGIYETKDAGVIWTNISGNLPEIKVNCVLMDNSDENRIYAGMKQGVYYKDDTMANWELFGSGLPRCDIRELEINYQANKLRAATYARGVWQIPIFGADNSDIVISPKIISEDVYGKCFGDSFKLSVKQNHSWLNPISYQWFKNGTLVSGATNLSYETTEEASYSIEVTANGTSGISLETSVNFLDTPPAPSVTGEQLCGAGMVTLTATGTGNGIIKWFSDIEGTDEVAEGNTFSVDIDETTTYYVKETFNNPILKIGLEDKLDSGSYYNDGDYLKIDVEYPFILKSAKVHANRAGDRTFQLRDAVDNILLSKTIYVEEGESRVNLDFYVPVGNELRIGLEEGLSLYRSTGDIDYPITLEGIMSITGSRRGLGYYYYLYDWEVQPDFPACFSPSSKATAVIGLNSPEVNDQTICAPGAVTLTATASENGTIRWYNSENPTEVIQTGNTLVTNIASNTTFLVDLESDSPDQDCIISTKASLTVTIEDCNGIVITPKIIVETLEKKCIGESIQLSVENDTNWETPITYQWYKNQTLISGASNSTYDATEQANYTVKVTTNESTGTSLETQINFLEAPTPPSVTGEQLCGAGTITLTATGAANGIIKWYSDIEGSNEIAEGNTYSLDISQTRTFYVKEVSSTTACYSTSTMAKAIVLTPADPPEVNNETVCTPGEVTITATSSENGTIRWYNNENPNEIIQTGSILTTYIENTTTFLVDVNPESIEDCESAKALLTVTMDDCLGLTTFENKSLILYPNPSNGLMNLKIPQGFNLKSIEITDVLGRSLRTYNEYTEQINLESFSSGTYLVKVISEKAYKVFKVVIP